MLKLLNINFIKAMFDKAKIRKNSSNKWHTLIIIEITTILTNARKPHHIIYFQRLSLLVT